MVHLYLGIFALVILSKAPLQFLAQNGVESCIQLRLSLNIANALNVFSDWCSASKPVEALVLDIAILDVSAHIGCACSLWDTRRETFPAASHCSLC